jgi:hypothetical protein
VEDSHLPVFWQKFCNLDLNKLNPGQPIRLSGMDVNCHILLDFVTITASVDIRYGIGLLAENLWENSDLTPAP